MKKVLVVILCIAICLSVVFACVACGDNETHNATYTRNGNYIYFGLYPQTRVNDESLLTNLNKKLNSELSKADDPKNTQSIVYKNKTYFAEQIYKNKNGEMTASAWFVVEPIKWQIIDESNGEALIVSELILDQNKYNETQDSIEVDGKIIISNNYEYCSLRTWLNNDFYNSAFNEEQQLMIIDTTVDNSSRSTFPNLSNYDERSNPYACNDTLDKVFLLSAKDVTDIVYGYSATDLQKNDNSRLKRATDYAMYKGVNTVSQDEIGSKGNSDQVGCGFWWLRSPSNYNDYTSCFVSSSGYIYYTNIRNEILGVVPALKISITA